MIEQPIVVDASVAMAWCFRDEATPQTDAVRDRVNRVGAVVPGHWFAEIENAARMGERRRRATPAEIAAFVQFIQAQLIEVDNRPQTAFGNLMPFARQYSLSVYDAAYVEVANRRGLSLATLDANMRRAAQQMGIDLVDLA